MQSTRSWRGVALALAALALSRCSDPPTGPVTPQPQPWDPGVISRYSHVAKIDLLLMIDNSSSMADKQEIFAQTVPELISRLVNPVCVDPKTFQPVGTGNPDGSCNQGDPDFEPIQDIHIGIISSSLGGHGASGVCDQPDSGKTFPHDDDRGHLLARGAMDEGVATIGGKPFLTWNPTMGGYGDANAIGMPFAQMVSGVGQHGCGYEASLESMYRFLIEPDPYDTITVDKSQGALGVAVLNGTDTALLQQRADFLRPDSLVSVIMMTDENDCSIVDGGQSFYVLVPPSGSPAKGFLTHGASACKTNPNDPCCYSCLQDTPAGCPDKQVDPECALGAWLPSEDPENLRCFNQKARYGIDFLYPVQRYIDGFTSTQIMDRHHVAVKNPLYSDLTCKNNVGCAAERDKSFVFLAGIVGVPWQDIAEDPMDLTKGYKTAKQLNDENVWQRILGTPTPADNSAPVLPADLHMIESVTPRAGLPGPDSAANVDPIHGHEWDTSKDSPPNRDLQYACDFPLANPRVCADATDCDCAASPETADAKNPLCQDALTNVYGNTQFRAKAYPGIRELQLLEGMNDQAIVASICPANVTDATRSDFGYRPAIDALIGRLRNALRRRCLPRALKVQVDGTIPCAIVEVFDPPPGQACTCDRSQGRTAASAGEVTSEMKAIGSCQCEIEQLTGDDKTTCQTVSSLPANARPGWCYVDPDQEHDPAECDVVVECPATDRRIIRFSGAGWPATGSTTFRACQESAYETAIFPPICGK